MKKKPTKLARSTVILALIALLAITAVSIGAAPGLSGDKDPQTAVQADKGGARSYIVLLEDWPLVVYEGEIDHLPATKVAPGEKLDAQSAAAQKYDAYLQSSQDKVLEGAGVSQDSVTNTYTVALNGFSAMMTETQAETMRRQEGVSLVMKDQWRQAMTNKRRTFLGLAGHGKAPKPGTEFDGEGVLVGIIDSGIWPEHPSFADDGSFPDAPVLDDSRPNCEFGNSAHNALDLPFTCNNKLVGARQMLDAYRVAAPLQPEEYDSARDDFGHGTHAASITAGNSAVMAAIYGVPRGEISGVAPRSQVIAYKVLGEFGALTSDLAAAVNQAVADGVDVINYGSGGGAGTPGADEMALLFAARAGVFVATAAGNGGPNPSTLTNPGTMPWMTTVAANTQERFFQGKIVLGNNRKYYGASITSGLDRAPLIDAEDAGDEFCSLGALDAALVEGKIVLCRRGVVGRPVKSLAVLEAGGVGTILYNNSDDDNLAADEHWTPAVHIDNTPGLAIKAYIDAKGSKATARIVSQKAGKLKYAPSVTAFSSRGPNPVAPDIIKPDITAPGSQVLGAFSPTPDVETTPPGELFAALEGTSFSSPYVAGAFALLKQAHPDWSPAMARSAVMTTAFQNVVDNDRKSPADPFDMGSGHLNLDPGKSKSGKYAFMTTDLETILTSGRGGRPGYVNNKVSFLKPGLLYDAGFNEYLGFLCDVFPELFGNPAATCGGLEAAGIPVKAYDLNYPSIGISELAGSQTVVRTVTADFGDVSTESGLNCCGGAKSITFRPKIKAPKGYKVRVSPKKLTLKDGETATFTVTISNQRAPIGEWRFGSLSWRGGEYEVTSPIAVRATLYNGSGEIDGSGESGSAAFEMTFGYTGSYSAAAHGLLPAAITTDNVVQDPDQDFDPNDGYSNAHQFNLSGDILLRVAIPPEATEPDADLDLYLQDPSGAFVASSESGGTNELIDIVEPVDGTWTLWVHGWAVPGGDANYDLYSWILAESPGGSLVIDSAPASAISGATESIDVSWSGATSGQWHLGTVSHSDDAGLIGLTLVDVDNR